MPRLILARRLSSRFGLVAGALLLVVGLILILVSYDAQLVEVSIRQQKTASEAVSVSSAYLSRAQDILWSFGQASSLQSLLLRSLGVQQKQLQAIIQRYPDVFQELTLLDDTGAEMAKVSRKYTYLPDELGSWEGRPAFERARQGDAYVADQVQVPAYSGFPAITMAVPLNEETPLPGTPDQASDGVLAADVSIKGMWDAMSQVEVGETGYAYIVDTRTGEIVGHSDLNRFTALQGTSLQDVLVVRQLMAGETEIYRRYRGLSGETVVGAAVPFPNTPWVMIVELPTREALAGLRQMLYLLAVLVVSGVAIIAGLGLVIPRRLLQPLHAVQQGAQEIGAGNLSHVIDVNTGDELQELAQTFNQMAASLEASQQELTQRSQDLEVRVAERTAELQEASGRVERRMAQLQTSANVARAIASVRDIDFLLPRIVQMIGDSFGWYHVGIFLLDESGQHVVLRAASSDGGRRMMARRHALEVGSQGLVGSVAASGLARVALDVSRDALYLEAPELGSTRSEMALPLQAGEPSRIIGVLDVQSTEPDAYDEQDIVVLSTFADQVAIAIENARHFAQTQQALEEVQTLHRQYVQQEWSRVVTQRDLAYEYRRDVGLASTEDWPPELVAAVEQRRVVTVSGNGPALLPAAADGPPGARGDVVPGAGLAMPIKLRDQVIGGLALQDTDSDRQWTDDEISLIQAISDQVGLALENARLLADTQLRAEQLATLHRVGLDITSALDLRGVLQALYEQTRRIVPTSMFYVALYDEATGLIEFPLMTGVDGPVEMQPISIHDQKSATAQTFAVLTASVIRTRKPLYVPDLATIPDLPVQPLWAGTHLTHAYIGLPLIFRERVFGVLSVQSYSPDAYTQDDVDLLTTMTTQASIAIQNARAYEQLVQTTEQLREVDRMKTQFLANMSHELRTPLNSIIGFSRVMLKGIDGPLTDLQEADLSSIYNSGQHLLSLINSILDMSKIEAGKMDLSFDEVQLPDIVGAVISTTRALVKDEPIELRTDVPEDLPTVWADAQRVRQVLINLLSNAAKFTQRGHITLSARVDAEWVTISVSDTGIGMDAEAMTRLFIPFQQVDASTTRRAGGTGLGLAISRSFVEMHGGKIWVESTPGKGSTFFFTLPIYQVVRAHQAAGTDLELTEDPSTKIVLAVDDDRGVITLLKRYLENDGYQVVGVLESPEALNLARNLAPRVAVITLDVVMPRMDGWQVLQALKRDPLTRDIPVVLCSIVEGLDQGLRMGAAACLRKPVTRDELLAVLKKVER